MIPPFSPFNIYKPTPLPPKNPRCPKVAPNNNRGCFSSIRPLRGKKNLVSDRNGSNFVSFQGGAVMGDPKLREDPSTRMFMVPKKIDFGAFLWLLRPPSFLNWKTSVFLKNIYFSFRGFPYFRFLLVGSFLLFFLPPVRSVSVPALIVFFFSKQGKRTGEIGRCLKIDLSFFSRQTLKTRWCRCCRS